MPDIFNLKDKVVLVTGSTGHLGAAIAERLAEAGALVLLNGRDVKKTQTQADAFRAKGLQAVSLPFDLTNDGETDNACAVIGREHGKLDGIVNNANLGTSKSLGEVERAEFEYSLNINLTSPFLFIQKTLPLLKKSAAPSIVNIASMYGSVSPDPRIYAVGDNNPVYYGAAKGGLIQMTRYLAVHLAADNIRVNAVSPGPFPPESIKQDDPAFHGALAAKVPLGRIGKAGEVTGCVQFLLSDAASYITGANIPVDGGWSAW